eukprot:1895427-Alexandrium_andersonii.AAC.1
MCIESGLVELLFPYPRGLVVRAPLDTEAPCCQTISASSSGGVLPLSGFRVPWNPSRVSCT